MNNRKHFKSMSHNNRNNHRNNNNNKINNRYNVYTPNNNDIEDLLMNLNKYSLTNKNIIQSICITEDNHIKNKKQNSSEVKITKKKDGLFLSIIGL